MQTPARKKWFLIPLFVVLALVIAGVFLFQSGFLVRPTAKKLAALIEVPDYDILSAQTALEEDILADYAEAQYSISEPYVIVDPYEMNPLSALILFDPADATSVVVTIQGDDAASTLTYEKALDSRRAEVPILGLYAGRDNTVTLKSDIGEVSVLTITTEPLPADFQIYDLVESQPDKMEPGFTLMTACFNHSYSAIIDANAQVRGYLSNTDMAHGTSMIQLENTPLIGCVYAEPDQDAAVAQSVLDAINRKLEIYTQEA